MKRFIFAAVLAAMPWVGACERHPKSALDQVEAHHGDHGGKGGQGSEAGHGDGAGAAHGGAGHAEKPGAGGH